MEKLISWGIVFGLVFVFYLIFVVFNKKKLKKIFESTGAKFIKGRYKISLDNVNARKFALVLATTDSFIFSTTFLIMSFFESMIISFLVAIPVLIVLIIALYSLLGLIYRKKEVK